MIKLSEVKEQLRSPLPWHVAGVAILAILALVLGVRFSLDWIATSGSTSDELQNRQTQLRMLEIQTAPLRGIDRSGNGPVSGSGEFSRTGDSLAPPGGGWNRGAGER